MGRSKGQLNKKHLPLKISICKQCRKEFSHKSCITRTFCSNICKYEYQKEHEKGRDNPNWKEEKSFYSNPRGLKRLIKNRDVICQDCGSHDNLQIHHRDINPSHNGNDNLILLCKSCHAQRHFQLGHPEVARIILSNHRYKERLSIICAICGKTFIPRDKRNKCCSRQCAYKLAGQSHKGHMAWNKGINDIILVCPICGKEFKRSKGRLDSKNSPHFCSKPCQIRYAINCRLAKISLPSDI